MANLDVKDPEYDSVIVVTDKLEKLVGNLECLKGPLENYAKVKQLSKVKICSVNNYKTLNNLQKGWIKIQFEDLIIC